MTRHLIVLLFTKKIVQREMYKVVLWCTKRNVQRDVKHTKLMTQRSLFQLFDLKTFAFTTLHQISFPSNAHSKHLPLINQTFPKYINKKSFLFSAYHSLASSSDKVQSATMAEICALEMLAPELQLQILISAKTPDDLHALIQASPRLHQVYQLNKDTVLWNVVRRQFHPTVLPDALFFAKMSQLVQPLTRDTVINLCKDYPGDLRTEATVPISIPISMSVALCNLASNVKFFIEDYARNTLPIMEALCQSLDVEIVPEYWPETHISYSMLSDSEIGRLQRAFCRFETYRYLFARCSYGLDHDHQKCFSVPSVNPTEQASLFLQKFPDFQFTEINCVRDYLYRRLRGICHQLEDEAFNTLPPETFVHDKDCDVESLEWASGVWLFHNSGKAYQGEQMEHLISLGLPYMRQIFETTGEERKILFLRHLPGDFIRHLETQFLTRALSLSGRNPARRDSPLLAKMDPPFMYGVNPNVELDIPDAWQWAHPDAPPLDLMDRSLKCLRDWGFVFWDYDRLRNSGILARE